MARRLAAIIVGFVGLAILAGCAAGERSGSSGDDQRPVFYGGMLGGGLPR